MIEDEVESHRRSGDVFRLYAEIYALRLDRDVVSLAPSGPVVLPTLEDGGPGEGRAPSVRRWRHRR